MKALPLKMGQGRGCWKYEERTHSLTAFVWCPDCGVGGALDAHSILLDGTVQPALACLDDCGFHSYVQLVGWEGNS
jgi:hypothetical protein